MNRTLIRIISLFLLPQMLMENCSAYAEHLGESPVRIWAINKPSIVTTMAVCEPTYDSLGPTGVRDRQGATRLHRSDAGIAMSRRVLLTLGGTAMATLGGLLWFRSSSRRSIAKILDGRHSEAVQAHVQAYFASVRSLSTGSWRAMGPAFFRINELGLEEAVDAVQHSPGSTVSIGLQETLIFAGLTQGTLVTVDINPMITEVAVPFFGILSDLSQSRKDLLSILLGVDLTDRQVQDLMTVQSDDETKDWILFKSQLREIVGQTSSSDRREQINAAYGLAEDLIFPNLSLDAGQRAHVYQDFLQWLSADRLDTDLAPQPSDQLRGAYLSANLAGILFAHRRLHELRPNSPTLFSDDMGLSHVQNSWRSGHWVGGTGDIAGPLIERAAVLLNSRRESVGVIYVGNVHSYLAQAKRSAREMYAALAELPLTATTKVILSQLSSIIRTTPQGLPDPSVQLRALSFSHAKWIFDYVNTKDEENVIPAMIEIPMAQNGQSSKFVAETLPTVLKARDVSEPEIVAETQRYRQLASAIERAPETIHGLTVVTFAPWAARQAPGLRTDTDYFRAFTAFLVETQRLPIPSEVVSYFSQKTVKPVVKRWTLIRNILITAAFAAYSTTIFYNGAWLHWGQALVVLCISLAVGSSYIREALKNDLSVAGGIVQASTRLHRFTEWTLLHSPNDPRPNKKLAPQDVVSLFLQTAGSRRQFEKRLMLLSRLSIHELRHRRTRSEFLVQSLSVFEALSWRIRRVFASRETLEFEINGLMQKTVQPPDMLVGEVLQPGQQPAEAFEDGGFYEDSVDYLIRTDPVAGAFAAALREITANSMQSAQSTLDLFSRIGITIAAIVLGAGIGYLIPLRESGRSYSVNIVEASVAQRRHVDEVRMETNMGLQLIGHLTRGSSTGRFDITVTPSPYETESVSLQDRGFVIYIDLTSYGNVKSLQIGDSGGLGSQSFQVYLDHYRDSKGHISIPVRITLFSPSEGFDIHYQMPRISQPGNDRDGNMFVWSLVLLAATLFWWLIGPLEHLWDSIHSWPDRSKARRDLKAFLRVPMIRERYRELQSLVYSGGIGLSYELPPLGHTLGGRASAIAHGRLHSSGDNRRPYRRIEILLNPLETDRHARYEAFVHEVTEALFLARLRYHHPNVTDDFMDAIIGNRLSDTATYSDIAEHAVELGLSDLNLFTVSFQTFTCMSAVEHFLNTDHAIHRQIIKNLGPAMYMEILSRMRITAEFLDRKSVLQVLLKNVAVALWESPLVVSDRWILAAISADERKTIIAAARELIELWNTGSAGAAFYRGDPPGSNSGGPYVNRLRLGS